MMLLINIWRYSLKLLGLNRHGRLTGAELKTYQACLSYISKSFLRVPLSQIPDSKYCSHLNLPSFLLI